ncbi:hypothetical protein [Martelella mangrovi]|uniref:Signal transduction histidine kinase n=1 Tax=Martelella mangrovi TaxID=1397477 RepID=A0ABV2I8R2_9HYPH
MDGFYSARGRSIPPLPWPTFAPPFSQDLKTRFESQFSRVNFGLGLSIVDELIRKGHGGTLKLLDRTPHGLVAEISLPAVHDTHAHPSVPG